MASSKILKETVERAQKEVKKLLTEVQTGKPDRSKLETGLKEVAGQPEMFSISI